MTATSLPELVVPDWTAREESKSSGGRFPLGLEAVGGHMVETYLLPAVTNATPHPRYFSFFAWAYWTFEQLAAPHIPAAGYRAAQRRWRQQLERALCLSTKHATPELNQIVGSRTAPSIGGLSRTQLVSLRDRAPTGMDPALYGAAFQYLGIGSRQGGRVALTSFGEELARAFDTALRAGANQPEQRALRRLLSGRPRIPAGALHDLAARYRIRPLEPGEPEHGPIMEALFRLDPTPPDRDPASAIADRCRARGLGLLLDLARDSRGTLMNRWDIFDVFATGRFVDGRQVEFRDTVFIEPFGVWQRFQERQHQKTSVNAVWHEVLNGLEHAHPVPVPAAALVGRCRDLAAHSTSLRELLGSDPLDDTVEHALSRMAARLPGDHGAMGEVALELAEAIREPETPGEVRVGLALQLLFTVVLQWETFRAQLSPFLRSLHAHGGPSRLTLPWMAAEVRHRQHTTVASLIQWLVEWCVLAQALRVAYDKMDQGDRFFIRREDRGYVLAQARQRPDQYFKPDSDRLRGALSLLRNLALIQSEGPLMLTVEGRKVLGRVVARG